MSDLPPLPPNGIQVLPVPTRMIVGFGADGLVVSVQIPCGLFGFILSPEKADALGRDLIFKATAARTGLYIPPANGLNCEGDHSAE